MRIVQQHNPDFSLIILGEGDQEVGGYVSKIKKLVEASGLEKQIIFAGHRPNVMEILASCDLFALPTFEEPFGMVFIEAMSMKKPVVALASGGAEEIIDNGKSGLLSQPNDIDAFAKNILTLMSNPKKRTRMGEYGRIRVESLFSVERMTLNFESLYRSFFPK
jgi:glycosyltransferase involved in cell wall biosynthesis